MKKRVLAAFLSAIMIVSCFSSCGSADPSAQNTTAEVSVTETAEAAAAAESGVSAAVSAQEDTQTKEKSAEPVSSVSIEADLPDGEETETLETIEPAVSEERSAETEDGSDELQDSTLETEDSSEENQEVPEKTETDLEETQWNSLFEETEESSEDTVASSEISELPEAAADDSNAEVLPAENVQALNVPSFLKGGLKPLEEIPEAQELSKEEQEQMDRAMRAYTPSKDTLLQNKAKTFYYYSQMTKDQQAMYDAMMMVCDDPANENNIAKAVISINPRSYDFSEQFLIAYYGMLYDHAELFWLYNYTECDMQASAPYQSIGGGKYEVYFKLDHPYKNYEKQMKAFNKAVKSFLKDIDTTKSKANIAKQIHNKLVNTVTYNTPVSLDNTEKGYCNFAHTAYGALVADSDGNKNYAVCDGYAQAFVYLLQQCGINAAVIVGIAGDDKYNASGHAWSVVRLDKEWYEVDSTWDDPGSLEELVEEVKKDDKVFYSYLREAFDDKDYRKKCRYYLYNVTTKTMSSFVPDSYYDYVSKDGKYRYSLLFESVHIRASDNTWGYENFAGLMDLAPVAKGTKHAAR